MEIWDLWYPKAGAQGLSFSRARIEPKQSLWVHAAPDVLRVEVRDEAGTAIAFASALEREGAYLPMTRLSLQKGSVSRTDRFPQPEDIGAVVLLAGGEAGTLTAWWNNPAGTEWRWSLEFYNRRA